MFGDFSEILFMEGGSYCLSLDAPTAIVRKFGKMVYVILARAMFNAISAGNVVTASAKPLGTALKTLSMFRKFRGRF
jgi:hypothetical protein